MGGYFAISFAAAIAAFTPVFSRIALILTPERQGKWLARASGSTSESPIGLPLGIFEWYPTYS